MVGWPGIERPEYVLHLNGLRHHLMSSACSRKDLTMVRSFTGSSCLRSYQLTLTQLPKVAGTYSPVEQTCIVLDTHRGIINGVGILVADVVLLLTMLVGLLRFTYRNPTGIWKLLYQQVTPKTLSLSWLNARANFFLVHNLASVSLGCRSSGCGLSHCLH